MGSVTIGANSYTIFGTQADAVTYVGAMLGTPATLWAASSASNQAKSLVVATRLLNALSWSGDRTDAASYLAFPRTGLTDRDGAAVSSSVVPTDVESASYELAVLLLTDPTMGSRTADKNVKKAEAGTAAVTFFRPQRVGIFPRQIMTLINQFLGGDTSTLTLSIATGYDVESSFDSADGYTIGRGGI